MSAVTIGLTLANLALAASCAGGIYYIYITRQRKRVGSSGEEDGFDGVVLPVSSAPEEPPRGCYRVLAVLCPCFVPLPKQEWDSDASSTSSSDQTSRPSTGGTQPGEASRPHRPLLGKTKSSSGRSSLSLSKLRLSFFGMEAEDGSSAQQQQQQGPIREGQFMRVEEWDGVRMLPSAQVLPPFC